MLLLALLVGLLAGLSAVVFYVLCEAAVHAALDGLAGYRPPYPAGEPPLWPATAQPLRPWLLILLPAVGGLITGRLVFLLAPEAEGHGTDAAIAAFHNQEGRVRLRASLVKMIASPVTLGTGGSGGREGPMSQIGAGLGSWVGRLFHCRPAEVRALMAAGMGAGVAAIFRTPLAGALFAGEILYRSADIEGSVIVPAALACTTAYCLFGTMFGWTPLLALPPVGPEALTFHDPRHLAAYSLLALAMIVLAAVFKQTFSRVTALFRCWTLPPHLKPAVGGLASGVVGVSLYFLLAKDPQVLGVLGTGYGALQSAMTAGVSGSTDLVLARVLLAIALGKILTTSLTIGSGGSAGVFGPSMVIGGCGGGALGLWLHAWRPDVMPHPVSCALVGMAGFFAAAAKAPISTLAFVMEMTGSFGLLLPTLWVSVLAFLFSDRQSLFHSQVDRRAHSEVH